MNGLHAMAAWIQQETSARRPGLDQTGVVMRTASVLLLLLPGKNGPELLFEVRSGNHAMQVKDGKIATKETEPWQGTIVYMQLQTDKEINPAEVVANRTDVAAQYREAFLDDNELEELW